MATFTVGGKPAIDTAMRSAQLPLTAPTPAKRGSAPKLTARKELLRRRAQLYGEAIAWRKHRLRRVTLILRLLDARMKPFDIRGRAKFFDDEFRALNRHYLQTLDAKHHHDVALADIAWQADLFIKGPKRAGYEQEELSEIVLSYGNADPPSRRPDRDQAIRMQRPANPDTRAQAVFDRVDALKAQHKALHALWTEDPYDPASIHLPTLLRVSEQLTRALEEELAFLEFVP